MAKGLRRAIAALGIGNKLPELLSEHEQVPLRTKGTYKRFKVNRGKDAAERSRPETVVACDDAYANIVGAMFNDLLANQHYPSVPLRQWADPELPRRSNQPGEMST